jgi:hypothetical protein
VKSSGKGARYRKVTRFVADALTGRLGVAAMVLGYSICAVVLLAYVSAKVYTYSLMEDISACERRQRKLKERIGLLTERYAELSAMDRVTEICEKKLGMVPAGTGQLIRVSIDSDWAPGAMGHELEDAGAEIPGVTYKSIDEITGVIRR